uniref:Uncharacterized protein n=1 Tax=Cairina moschata TaxID=8855 RepID=A0A8C3BSJ9_CAIMO
LFSPVSPLPLASPTSAAALPAPNGDSLGLRLGSWLLRVLRECAYLLLCSWCIRELLD